MIGLQGLAPGRIRRAKAGSAFGHRNYRLFFVGQAVSLVGTWMQQVAQGWLVLHARRRRSGWAWSRPPSSCPS